MILKIRQYSDCDYGRIEEDRIFENPKELSIQRNRFYSKELAKKIKIPVLFPVTEKECMCSFIHFYINDVHHAYACWPGSIFIMSDSGETIDKY